MARWLVTFDNVINPNDLDGVWKTGIPERFYRLLQRQGHEARLARIVCVDAVMTTDGTDQIYRGWSRPDKDDCFVYVGSPSEDHRSLTIHTPPPTGCVFLVFVLPDGTIDDWGWRPVKPGTTEPEGVTGELIWSRTQN